MSATGVTTVASCAERIVASARTSSRISRPWRNSAASTPTHPSAVMIGVTNAPGESRSPATDTSSPERQDAAVALLASVAMVPNRASTAVG